MLAVGYYLIFTGLHESMHRIAYRNRALNTALGRVRASRWGLRDGGQVSESLPADHMSRDRKTRLV